MPPLEIVRHLPEDLSVAAVLNPNSTHARKGAEVCIRFGLDPKGDDVFKTEADPERNYERLVEFLNKHEVDVILALGGDGLLNQTGRALRASNNRYSALAPGETAGAGDGRFLTQGPHFLYTPKGFVGQPVINTYPLHITAKDTDTHEELKAVGALLYASFGGFITQVALGVNQRSHRDLLRAAETMPPLARRLTRRTAEAATMLRALDTPRFIIGSPEGYGARFVSDIVVVNGGRIAGLLHTLAELLDASAFHSLETRARHELVVAAARLIVGQEVYEFQNTNKQQFRIMSGQHVGERALLMQFDGETTTFPVPSIVTIEHSTDPVPLVYSEEVVQNFARRFMTRARGRDKH